MNVLKYDKDTGKFEIYISGQLKESHKRFIKLFSEHSPIPISELVSESLEEETWQERHHSLFELHQLGLLKETYNPHTQMQAYQLSEIGKAILKKIV